MIILIFLTSEIAAMEKPNFVLIKDFDSLFENVETQAKEFIKTAEAKNTSKKTDGDIRKINDFIKSKVNGKSVLEEFEPKDLNLLLVEYFQNLTPKQAGTHYEPGTIRGIAYSVERYLKTQGYEEWKVLSSNKFALLQDVLKAKMALSKSAGKGNRPNRAMPITHDEEERLWTSGALGLEHPKALLRTLWWTFTVYFGLRGRQEHHQMLWGDVELLTMTNDDGSETEYLEMTEHLTKTRRGADGGRAFSPKIFPMDDKARCPVEAFKRYASKRPEETGTDPHFYLAVNYSFESTGNWFKKSLLGERSLGDMMKDAAQIANITGKRVANHSARKTAVKRLMDGGCPPTYVAQWTGHASTSSLLSYTEADMTTQRKMAKTISTGAAFNDIEAKPTENRPAQSCDEVTPISKIVTGHDFHQCTFNITYHQK